LGFVSCSFALMQKNQKIKAVRLSAKKSYHFAKLKKLAARHSHPVLEQFLVFDASWSDFF
jgi:hypothetical protein